MDKTPQFYALSNFSRKFAPFNNEVHKVEAVVISGNKIQRICSVTEVPNECEIIDLEGNFLTPGFIDLQLNGCGGVLFNEDISERTLNIMHATNLQFGCTSFLPTLITCSDNDMVRAVEVTKEYMKKYPDRVPGLHLEGPFISKARKGIHDEQFIRTPTKEIVDYICSNSDVISMITVAPEVCRSSIINRIAKAGIIVSIGHSDATLLQVREAERAGATFVTHLFNAMSQLQNREPGIVGAVLSGKSISAGVIADGYHLDWSNFILSWRLLGDRLTLVTDATSAAGSEITEFQFGGNTVYHNHGRCTGKDGTLGGSALTMIDAIRNSVGNNIPIDSAIDMATKNPAKVIDQYPMFGKIKPGAFANIVILDKQLNVIGTVSGGNLNLPTSITYNLKYIFKHSLNSILQFSFYCF